LSNLMAHFCCNIGTGQAEWRSTPHICFQIYPGPGCRYLHCAAQAPLREEFCLFMPKHTQPIRGRQEGSSRISLPAILLGAGLIAAMVLAVLFSNLFSTHNPSKTKRDGNPGNSEAGSTAILGKATQPPPAISGAPGSARSAPSAPAANNSTKSSAASPVIDEAQKAKQDELARKQAELDAVAAQQAAQQQALAAAQQQVEERKKEAEAQEAANLKKQQDVAAAAAAIPIKPAYSGPTSGDIVWQGTVNGTTLVTITGDTCDSGTLVSGGLPGVPVIIQPRDAKKTRVASTPAPSNAYQRLVFGVSGNGTVQVVLHWSRS
jgi:hypothetical protein